METLVLPDSSEWVVAPEERADDGGNADSTSDLAPPSPSYWIDDDEDEDEDWLGNDGDALPDSTEGRPSSPSAWSMETVLFDPSRPPSPDQSHWWQPQEDAEDQADAEDQENAAEFVDIL